MFAELKQQLSGPIQSWLPEVTLLFLLSYQHWKAHVPQAGSIGDLLGKVLAVLAVAGLMLGSASENPWFWLCLTVVHFSWIAATYHTADNHHYLIGYWCLTMVLALYVGGADGEELLRRDGALLIGICFAFAVAAKASNPGYRDGGFFLYAFMFDRRFRSIAFYVSGIDTGLRGKHIVAAHRVNTGQSQLERAPIPLRARRAALLLSWWTLAIEAVVAALFLLPVDDGLRVFALVVFVVTTFSFVSVPSFGQLLLILLLPSIDGVIERILAVSFAAILPLISFTATAINQSSAVVRQQPRPQVRASGGFQPSR